MSDCAVLCCVVLRTVFLLLPCAAYIFGMYEEDDKTYCAAPIVSSKREAGTPVAYWAVGENCCDRVSGTFTLTCKYWGENIPTRTPGLFMLSGEVMPNRLESRYRRAVEEYLSTEKAVTETTDSLLVVAMKYEDHLERQEQRRKKAYMALLFTAALWPLVLVLLAAAQWAFDTVSGACASKPHHTQ